MLAFKSNNTWTLWTGEQRPRGGSGLYTLPANAETAMSSVELRTFGLYRVIPGEPAPEGHQVTAWSLVDVGGKPAIQNTFTPIVIPVPSEVSPRQISLALNQLGLLADVEAFIAAGPLTNQIEWSRASTIRRDHPMLVAGATALGKTDADIDALFRLAAKF